MKPVLFDPSMPVTNPALLTAIDAYKQEPTPATQEAYLSAVQKARFLLPVVIEPKPEPADVGGKTVLQVDTVLKFRIITDANGNNYYPVYTDWPSLKQWRDIPDEETLVLSYEDISCLVFDDPKIAGFVINPESDNLAVLRDIIRPYNGALLNRLTVKKATAVRIGLPVNDPTAFKKAVCKYLKTQKRVQAAWLVLMEKEGEFSLLMVVAVLGDPHAVFEGIASIAASQLKTGELLDLMSAEGHDDITLEYEPFYKRGSLRKPHPVNS